MMTAIYLFAATNALIAAEAQISARIAELGENITDDEETHLMTARQNLSAMQRPAAALDLFNAAKRTLDKADFERFMEWQGTLGDRYDSVALGMVKTIISLDAGNEMGQQPAADALRYLLDSQIFHRIPTFGDVN